MKAFYENLREKMVEQEVERLLKATELSSCSDNYNPSNRANFEEFLGNMPAKDIDQLLKVLENPVSSPRVPRNDAALGRALRVASNSYWKDLAKVRAERDIPSAEQLMAEHALID